MTQKNKPSTQRTWFVADAPLSDADRDAFGHPDVANNLLTMLREPQRGRRMIGLLGSFGVGKSSVVELLGNLLAGDREFSLIRVSAERHEIENFHRSFVFSVAEAIVERELATRSQVEQVISRLEYSTTQSWSDFRLSAVGRLITRLGSRLRSKLGKVLMVVGGVLIIATLILLGTGFFATDTASRVMAWIAASIGSIATTLTAVPLIGLIQHAAKQAEPFKPGQSTSMRPRAEAADEYERVFASLVQLVKSRLVIAVDDVDRLDQREILPALNAIRSFQLTVPAAKQPTFIVSLDDTIIAPALVAQRKEQGTVDPENADLLIDEYLNRLFTLRQTMPLHAKRDLRSYARDLLVSTGHRGAEKLGTSLETVLNILIHDEVQSPRHVIRLLNAFFADYRLAIQREKVASGKRAISSGLITSAPAVLARMTVLKNDFPTFFGALVVDTRLLSDVENDVRGALDEKDSWEIITKAGFLPDSSAYASLKRFIGRTATWTENIDDLLPFLYLGQDSVERSMGSADARRALSTLSNRQIADFSQLLTDATAASEERREAYIESIVDATRSLEGLELANALATIAENATQASELSTSIADVFADGLFRTPSTNLSTEGLAILLDVVSSNQHREVIADALALIPDDEDQRGEWISSVLDHDQKIAAHTVAIGKVRQSLQQAIGRAVEEGSLTDLEEYASRLRGDSDVAMAETLLSSTLRAVSQSDDDLTDAFAKNAPAAAAALGKHVLSDAMRKAVTAAIGGGATTNGALAALRIIEEVDVSDPQQLADLAHAYVRSATVSTRDALADGFEAAHLRTAEWLLAAALRHAPAFASHWGAQKKLPIPRQIAEVLALSIDAWNTIYAGSNSIVAELLETRPQDATPVVISAARLLSTATEEVDEDEQALLECIVTYTDGLTEEALTPIKAALRAALAITSDDDLRAQVIALLPHVRDSSSWGPWLEPLTVDAASAGTQTLTTCEASAAVVLAAAPAEPTATATAAVFDLVRNRMIPYRHNALAVHVVGNYPWPEGYRAQALELIAPILGEGEDAALEAVFAQLGKAERGELSAATVVQFRAVGTSRLEDAATAQVIRHLPFDEAFDTALSLGEYGQTLLLEALNAAPAEEVSAFIEEVPGAWVNRPSSIPSAVSLLATIAKLNERAYVEAVTELVRDFTSNDDFVVVPERLGEIVQACEASVQPVAEAIKSNLDGAAHEVRIAARLLPAVGTSPSLDKALADASAGAIVRWSREQLDREVSVHIAEAVRSGRIARSAALEAIGPRGPRKEPAKAIYLSVRSVLGGP